MGEKLYLQPKMGLVPEVSMQNYDTIAKQLREIITNSLDANAKNVRITFVGTEQKGDLIVEDDGDGMDKALLKNSFLALGGSEKYFDKSKIGRIGIGFLAAVPLCREIEITTRKKGTSNVIIARLESEKLTLEELRGKAIENFPVGEIIEEISNADSKGYSPNFTKIKLIDIKELVLDHFKSPGKMEKLKGDLRKILPLKYDMKSKIFEHISPELKGEMTRMSEEYCLNVFLNSKEPLVRKVYGDLEHEDIYAIKEFKDERVSGNLRIVGYFVYKKNAEGYRSHELKKWDGLIVRVQNVAVVESGFLGFEGRDERKKRVCGEIFVLGIDKNKAITIDRNSFNEDNPQYRKVKIFIHERLDEFFDGLNFDWELKSELNRTIGAAVKLNKVMQNASHSLSNIKEKKVSNSNLANLERVGLVNLKELRGQYDKIQIDDKGAVDSEKGYRIVWEDLVNKNGSLKIDRKLYEKNKWSFEIEGNNYIVEFVNGDKDAKPCEVNKEKNGFLLNRNNSIIASLKPDYIMLCILIEYCRIQSKDKTEFADRLFNLMEGLLL